MPISLHHDYRDFSENLNMENSGNVNMTSGEFEESGKVLNLKATELRLGLPGSESPERDEVNGHGLLLLKGFVSGAKRGFSPKATLERKTQNSAPASKAQVVGWPPIRSFRKNSMAVNPSKTDEDGDTKSGSDCLYVKVSMDGAPYLRKVDLRAFNGYKDLSSALEKMFSTFTIGQYSSQGIPTREGLSESGFKDLLRSSEFVLTFEDKDGDWMLVGDVPWEMFMDSCKRLRIMKSSDAIGLAPRGVGKCKTEN